MSQNGDTEANGGVEELAENPPDVENGRDEEEETGGEELADTSEGAPSERGVFSPRHLELTFTEDEVIKKISDLKDQLKIRASSVRKPNVFDEKTTDIKTFVADFDNYRRVLGSNLHPL